MKKNEVQFIRRGDKVEVVVNTPKEELSPFDILGHIANLQQAISKTENDMLQTENNLKRMKESMIRNNDMMKKFVKHADWARTAQESTFKAVLESLEQEVYERVKKEYKFDEALTEEQNNAQCFHQFRQYIATDKRMVDKVAQEVVSTKLFEEGVLRNPWKE